MSWTIECRGRVAVVTMTTNPVNAQNQAFFADLHDAFDRLERDRPDSPVVLTGTDRRFSAGLDLDEHVRLFASDPATGGSGFAGYRATNMRLFTYPRPTVAAINGTRTAATGSSSRAGRRTGDPYCPRGNIRPSKERTRVGAPDRLPPWVTWPAAVPRRQPGSR